MMLRKISFPQLLEWKRYDQLDPFGDIRGDWRAASICATLANIAVSKGKSKRRFRVQDFLLEWGDERPGPKVTTAQELKAKAMTFAAMINAAENSPRKRKR